MLPHWAYANILKLPIEPSLRPSNASPLQYIVLNVVDDHSKRTQPHCVCVAFVSIAHCLTQYNHRADAQEIIKEFEMFCSKNTTTNHSATELWSEAVGHFQPLHSIRMVLSDGFSMLADFSSKPITSVRICGTAVLYLYRFIAIGKNTSRMMPVFTSFNDEKWKGTWCFHESRFILAAAEREPTTVRPHSCHLCERAVREETKPHIARNRSHLSLAADVAAGQCWKIARNY